MGRRSRASRAAVWLLPMACLSAALACAASSNAAKSRPNTVNALVVGRVVQCGAAPGRPVHCYPHDHAVVSAFNAEHRLVARERITNAHFSFLLGAGRYMLEARASGQPGAARWVTAHANRTVHAVLAFAEP